MKYELTEETLVIDGVTLRRIRRLSDGALGGWIEKESNLSQLGTCWVADEAMVYGEAFVSEDAQITGDARVFGEAVVFGDAELGAGTWTYGRAMVYGTQQAIDSVLPPEGQ